MALKLAPEDHRHRHYLEELPYRALVHISHSPSGTPLYLVAGCEGDPAKAENALRKAVARYGGRCFYCDPAKPETSDLSIDHVEPRSRGGSEHLHNLVLACRKCNHAKGAKTIEAFRPNAGRRWLLAAHALIRTRLNLIREEEAS